MTARSHRAFALAAGSPFPLTAGLMSSDAPSKQNHGVPTLGTLNRFPVSVRVMGWLSLAVLLVIYFVYPSYPTVVGKSLAGWTWYGCNSVNGFLHGRFIPVAFIVMCWMAYQRTKDEPIRSSYWGLPVLLFGLLLFLVSLRTIQPRMATIGVPFVVIGYVHFLFGAKVTRHLIFPAFFWWFAMPVPGLETLLTGRLQVLITKFCYHGGLLLGMDLTLQGSDITVAGSTVKIAEGCSGIRSLMALVMIAAVYANYTQKELWKKAVLFLSSFPLAIIGNFGRIFTILILSHFGFEDFAKKTYHDWAGLLFFFPIALSGLYLVDYLLNLKTRRKKKTKRSVKSVSTVSKGGVTS